MTPFESLLLWPRVALWSHGLVLGLWGCAVSSWALGRPASVTGSQHWSEHARRLQPRRALGAIARFTALGVSVFCVMMSLSAYALSPWRSLLTVALACAGPLVAALVFEAAIYDVSFVTMVRSWLTRTFVTLGALYVAVLVLVVRADGVSAWLAVPVGVAICAWLSVGGGLFIASWFGLARVARPAVLAAVERAGGAKRVWEIDWAAANALAFPLLGHLAFTTSMATFDAAEIEAIAHHEIGHLREPLATKLYRAGLIVIVTCVVMFAPELMRAGLAKMLGLLLVVLAVLLASRRLIRLAERAADSHAHHHGDEGTYARALEKMYQLNRVPAVLSGPGSHGHLYDRLVEAGQAPSWPRPEAPAGARARRLVLTLALLVPVALGAALRLAPETDPLLQLALGGPSQEIFGRLAFEASERGEMAEADEWDRLRARLVPDI